MWIQTQYNIFFFSNADITGILFVGKQNEEELDFQELLLTLDKKIINNIWLVVGLVRNNQRR